MRKEKMGKSLRKRKMSKKATKRQKMIQKTKKTKIEKKNSRPARKKIPIKKMAKLKVTEFQRTEMM